MCCSYERYGYRAFRLDRAEFDGRTAGELEAAFGSERICVERIRRGRGILDRVTPDTPLQRGDILALGAWLTAMIAAERRIGPEVGDTDLLSFPLKEAELVITRANFAGRRIDELAGRYGRGIFLNRITRGQQELPGEVGTVLQRGDVLHCVGTPPAVERVALAGGFIDPDPGRFALPFLAGGLTVGILVGLVTVRIGTLPVALGTSCATLLTGLATRWARSCYPLFGGIPDAATRLLQDVGLTVLIAIVGLTAGPHAMEVLHTSGPSFFGTVLVAGVFVTLAPQIVGFYVGAKLFRIPVAALLGGLAGAQTATPAPNALKEADGNNVFVLGFTVPYAINDVLLTLSGTVIVTVVYSWGQ